MPTGQTILHRWFDEVWNQGREATIDELLHDGCMIHGLLGPDGNEVSGPAPFKAFWNGLRQTFPDIRIDVEEALSEGDLVAARCLVNATEANSRKPIRITGMVFARHRDGRVVEVWNNFDFLTMERLLQ